MKAGKGLSDGNECDCVVPLIKLQHIRESATQLTGGEMRAQGFIIPHHSP